MKINTTPLISVVVPVYNVEKYIHKCIDSVLAQTYENLEVILVDDGSPDNCPVICDNYSQKYGRVKVIHKKNGGLSDARNAGINYATGEFIAFIDSDDYVHPNFISHLFTLITDYEADISVCSFMIENNYDHNSKKLNENYELFNNLQSINDYLSKKSKCKINVWNKLYRTSLIKNNNLYFPKGRIHEDLFITYKLLYYAKLTVYSDNAFYYYLKRDDSIMGHGFSKKSLDVIDALDEMLHWFNKKNIPYKKMGYSFKLSQTLYLLGKMSKKDMNNTKYWNYLTEWIRTDLTYLLFRNRKISFSQKVFVIIVIFGRKTTYLCFHTYRKLMSVLNNTLQNGGNK